MDRTALDQLQNGNVFSTDGEKIGSVGQVYLDDVTNEPTFVTVKTGLFGANETFVPLQQAQTTTDGITVPFTKDFVKDAPNVDADGSLTPEEEQRIYEYYSMEYTSAEHGRDAAAAGTVTTGTEHVETERRAAVDNDGDSMVLRDEHLQVGTERKSSGRVRLRKQSYTTTETVEVPVTREEVVVERESIDANSADARVDGDNEVSVTTYEETPVVNKTVDAEKVSLGKRQVQDTETVTEDLTHEDVQIDRDGDVRNDRDGLR